MSSRPQCVNGLHNTLWEGNIRKWMPPVDESHAIFLVREITTFFGAIVFRRSWQGWNIGLGAQKHTCSTLDGIRWVNVTRKFLFRQKTSLTHWQSDIWSAVPVVRWMSIQSKACRRLQSHKIWSKSDFSSLLPQREVWTTVTGEAPDSIHAQWFLNSGHRSCRFWDCSGYKILFNLEVNESYVMVGTLGIVTYVTLHTTWRTPKEPKIDMSISPLKRLSIRWFK